MNVRNGKIVKSSVKVTEDSHGTRIVSDKGKTYDVGFVVGTNDTAFDMGVIVDFGKPEGPQVVDQFWGEDKVDDKQYIENCIEAYEFDGSVESLPVSKLNSARKPIKSGLMTPSLTSYAQGTYKDVKQMLDAIDGGMDYSNGNAMNFLFGLDNKSFDEVLLPYSFIIFTFRHTDGTPWTDDELDAILDENNGMLP